VISLSVVILKALVKRILRIANYDLVKVKNVSRRYPVELSSAECEIIDYVLEKNLTMVSFERLVATLMSCKHAILNSIEGDFVECGVWRGGNAIVAAEMIRLYGSNKHVYLYDTFTGMTEPTKLDVDLHGTDAINEFNASKRAGYNAMYYASLDDVQEQFRLRHLLNSNIHFIQGDVNQTLASNKLIPSKISMLRLDTDWYESTKVELQVLYPKLSVGGCLIIDDYGIWQGSRKAVDEYFAEYKPKPFLQYIDNTGRLSIKQS
jgi:O-methyltransferase